MYVMLANGCEDFAMAPSDQTFMVTEDGSFAYYVPEDRSFVVAKKKSDESQRHQISPQDWPKFEEAIREEFPEVMKKTRECCHFLKARGS